MRNKSWRRHQTQRIINNRLHLLWLMRDERYSTLERGRLAKKSPYDCGKTRCGVCHPEKRWSGNYKYSNLLRKEPIHLRDQLNWVTPQYSLVDWAFYSVN